MASSIDIYGGLLQPSHSLRPELTVSRELWFAGLVLADKREIVFELEALLKGLVCFGNLENHPGELSQIENIQRNFHEDTAVVQAAMDRAIRLIRQLLGSKDRTYTFSRYLQSLLPTDEERRRLIAAQHAQSTPEDSLMALRSAFSAYRELAEGLLHLDEISNRCFFSLHYSSTLEIERNAFFCPLVDLEFKPELDELEEQDMVQILKKLESEPIQRLVALVFLTLSRGLRYLECTRTYLINPTHNRLVYCILAAFRSDIYALKTHLDRREGMHLAQAIEYDIFRMRAATITTDAARLLARMPILLELKRILHTTIHRLSIDMERCFRHEVPSLSSLEGLQDEQISASLTTAVERLYVECMTSIHVLCRGLGATNPMSPEAQERVERFLAREGWMLVYVLKGALTMMERGDHAAMDSWSTVHAVYTRQLKSHLQTIGFRLMLAMRYPRQEALLAALRATSESSLDPRRASETLKDECEKLLLATEELIKGYAEKVGPKVDESIRKEAKEALRFYLSDLQKNGSLPAPQVAS